MLRLIGLAAQASLVLVAMYNAITALWGWTDPRPAPEAPRRLRFRIVVPAHNEERVLPNLLADLLEADYPTGLFDIVLLADRCSDRTVDVARSAGVDVAERVGGPEGKGAALSWYIGGHPLASDEVLLVMDADNRAPANLLGRLADEIETGRQVVQCYLDVANPDSSLIAEASALSYWAGNRMVQLARTNLGWSADLGGTGMAVTSEALEAAGGFGESLTEDQDLGIRLSLAGYRVHWAHDIRVLDEKPDSLGVAVRQRSRWMAGKRSARREHLGTLVASGSPSDLDLAFRLVQPGRSFVALLSGLFTAAAVLTGSSWLLPWQLWAAVTALQVLEPIPFLARDGVPASKLIRYPLLALLAAMWVPVRIVSSRVAGWYHTPHEGSNP